MTRTLKLTLSYDGTNYCGWQLQPNGPTIQQAVEKALAKVLCQRIRVTASGRTDSGVHAFRQVASCQVESDMPPTKLCRALNGNLPIDIRILDVADAHPEFHAIRDAVRKRYRYVIHDGPIHDVFMRDYAWHLATPVDAERMHAAGQALVGQHDFISFQAADSDRKTTTRQVFELTVRRDTTFPDRVVLEIEADGFLYNMVRNMTGTLVEVGQGSHDESWPEEVLAARDRRCAGRTAPPQGLFMLWVEHVVRGEG